MFHEPHQTVFYRGFKGAVESNGLRLSFGSSSIGTYIAIELTPGKLTADEIIEVQAYMDTVFGGGEIVASQFRLFEAELALDMPYALDDLVIFAPKVRKINLAYQKDGQIEIGSKQGNRWIRIYDKQKQLKEDKGVSIKGPLTRVECVLRKLPTVLAKCNILPNPFDNLIVVLKQTVPKIKHANPADFGLRHFCDKVIKGASGHIAYWDVEDAGMRKAVCNQLRPHSEELTAPAANWEQWVGQELSSLRSVFLQNHG